MQEQKDMNNNINKASEISNSDLNNNMQQSGMYNNIQQPEMNNSNQFSNNSVPQEENDKEILNENVYELVTQFKKRHPMTIAWRLKQNSKVVQDHLNPGEKVRYAFAAQKNNNPWDIITTCVVALTDRRLLIGQKRVVFGYFYYSITPDLYNDMQVKKGIFWGDVIIDTLNELVNLSHIAPDALDEIETNITTFMLKEKQRFRGR